MYIQYSIWSYRCFLLQLTHWDLEVKGKIHADLKHRRFSYDDFGIQGTFLTFDVLFRMMDFWQPMSPRF